MCKRIQKKQREREGEVGQKEIQGKGGGCQPVSDHVQDCAKGGGLVELPGEAAVCLVEGKPATQGGEKSGARAVAGRVLFARSPGDSI